LRHSKVQVTREGCIKVRDPKVEAAMSQLEVAIAKLNDNQYAVQ
jgi:hypothetical protein